MICKVASEGYWRGLRELPDDIFSAFTALLIAGQVESTDPYQLQCFFESGTF